LKKKKQKTFFRLSRAVVMQRPMRESFLVLFRKRTRLPAPLRPLGWHASRPDFILSLCAGGASRIAPLRRSALTPQLAQWRRRLMDDLIASGLGLGLILVMAAYAALCERI